VSGSDEREAEFQDFVVARSPGLYRTALLLTASPHAAEDLVQATLVKTYVAWWRVRGATDPVAYAHGILVKTFRSDRRRRSAQELPTDRVLEPGTPAPEHEPADRILLLDALRQLPDIDRAVVVLRYWEDLSVHDTAATLHLSQAAVKNRSLRALRTLRALLGDHLTPQDTTTGRPR
jgi:RNA polymerase sigma-70 factor (sigma-E family)